MALANLAIAPGSPSVASTAIDSDTDPEAPEWDGMRSQEAEELPGSPINVSALVLATSCFMNHES